MTEPKVRIVIPDTHKKTNKIRILVWADSPACATGFGTVIRGIFNHLVKTGRYDIDMIGINDRGGWKDPKKYPYRIYPAKPGSSLDEGGDVYGRPRLVASLLGKDPDIFPPWDIVFTLNDPFILEEPMPVFNLGTMMIVKKTQLSYEKGLPADWHFKIVSYWPVDSPIKGNWVEKAMSIPDRSVAYTNYGRDEIFKADNFLDKTTDMINKTSVIYHGVNTSIFKPIDDKTVQEFRKNLFEDKIKPETFLITAVARNQVRKDLPRTMKIFKEFQKRRPDSFLYIHSQESDVWGSLREYAREFNLELGRDWATPARFNANTGFPIKMLNLIYNASQVVLSTTLGEGFGFYNMEAFATKTLVIAPNNTCHPELLNYDKKDNLDDLDALSKKIRGLMYRCGSTSSEWTCYGPTDWQRVRPLGNVDDAVKKLLWAYDNQDKVKEITERAYNWVQDYTWEKISQQWDNLFTEVYNNLKVERKSWKPPKVNKDASKV